MVKDPKPREDIVHLENRKTKYGLREEIKVGRETWGKVGKLLQGSDEQVRAFTLKTVSNH